MHIHVPPSIDNAIQGVGEPIQVRRERRRSTNALTRLEVRKRACDALNVGNVFEQLGDGVPFAANESLSRVIGKCGVKIHVGSRHLVFQEVHSYKDRRILFDKAR